MQSVCLFQLMSLVEDLAQELSGVKELNSDLRAQLEDVRQVGSASGLNTCAETRGFFRRF